MSKKQSIQIKSRKDKSKEDTDPQYDYLNLNQLVQCHKCFKDISKNIKIYIPYFKKYFCSNCFCKLNTFYDYYVINSLNYALYDKEWTAEQQLLLIIGLQKYGFGNWSQIAENFLTNKNKQQIQFHYNSIYLQPISLNQIKVPLLVERDKNNKMNIKKVQNKRGRKPKPVPIQEILPQSQPKLKQKENQQSNTEIAGYMPLRKDFQIQYDNDAELLLAQMEFKQNQSEQQKDLKIKILKLYNSRLDQRILRRNFAIERKLLDFQTQLNLDKNRIKQQKQLYNMMKVFARFNTLQDHEKLVQGLHKQRQLRKKIQQLSHYHKLGLKNFQQVDAYLNFKKNNQSIRIKKQNSSDNFIWDNKHLNNRRNRHNKVEIKVNSVISKQEEEMCEKYYINHYQYLAIRQAIIREYLLHGYVNRINLLQNINLEKNKINSIIDYLVLTRKIIQRK